MAASILSSPLLVPIFTTLVGAGGVTVGLYSLLNLTASARIYGIPVLTTSSPGILPDLTTFLVSSPPHQPSTTDNKNKPQSPNSIYTQPQPPSHLPNQTTTLLLSLAIRNMAIGSTILSLTAAYYQFAFASPADPTILVLKQFVREILGSVIIGGSVVPFVDAAGCWMSEVGRRAMWVHIVRGVGWVVVGCWCRFGW